MARAAKRVVDGEDVGEERSGVEALSDRYAIGFERRMKQELANAGVKKPPEFDAWWNTPADDDGFEWVRVPKTETLNRWTVALGGVGQEEDTPVLGTHVNHASASDQLRPIPWWRAVWEWLVGK
jgi:hypothetical protein